MFKIAKQNFSPVWSELCLTSNIQTKLYPSMLTQSSCLVLCFVSLIILNKPPPHNSPLHLPLFLFNPFPHHYNHPSLSQSPVPLCHSHCSSLGLQRVRAGDIEPAPPSCVLWQHHVSTATVDDVRMAPRGGHHLLSLSTDSMGCRSVHRMVCKTIKRRKGFSGNTKWPVRGFMLRVTANIITVNYTYYVPH